MSETLSELKADIERKKAQTSDSEMCELLDKLYRLAEENPHLLEKVKGLEGDSNE